MVLAAAAGLFTLLAVDAAVRVGFDGASQVAEVLAGLTALLMLLHPQVLGALVRAVRHGPSSSGYDLMLAAHRTAAWTAVCAAGLQLAPGITGTTPVRRRVLALAALAAGTAVPVLALIPLGGSLVSLHPLEQPPALTSMLLAVLGTGWDLVPVPAAFAIAAAAVPLLARRHRS